LYLVYSGATLIYLSYVDLKACGSLEFMYCLFLGLLPFMFIPSLWWQRGRNYEYDVIIMLFWMWICYLHWWKTWDAELCTFT